MLDLAPPAGALAGYITWCGQNTSSAWITPSWVETGSRPHTRWSLRVEQRSNVTTSCGERTNMTKLNQTNAYMSVASNVGPSKRLERTSKRAGRGATSTRSGDPLLVIRSTEPVAGVKRSSSGRRTSKRSDEINGCCALTAASAADSMPARRN